VDATTASVTLVLNDLLGVHGLCDMYEASLRTADGEEHSGLIVKLVDLLEFPTVRGPKAQPSRAMASEDFAGMFHCFRLLQPIQGTIVPRYAGLFARGTLYCAVFEDAGRYITNAEKMDPKVQ
jgi:hypothetical protein